MSRVLDVSDILLNGKEGLEYSEGSNGLYQWPQMKQMNQAY